MGSRKFEYEIFWTRSGVAYLDIFGMSGLRHRSIDNG
jgi:hypothetical protein